MQAQWIRELVLRTQCVCPPMALVLLTHNLVVAEALCIVNHFPAGWLEVRGSNNQITPSKEQCKPDILRN